jgi:hypothetical protein
VPGSQNNPIPKVGTPGGDHGKPRPGGGGGHPRLPAPKLPPITHHKPDPPKVTPPNQPINLRATPQPDGTIKLDFEPGGGGKATGFKLLMPDGLTATPQQVDADGPDYTFTVNGGVCGEEYRFAVAATYQNQDHASEIDSGYTPPAMSCTEPDAPSGLTGTATTEGARISWQAPPNAESKKVTYNVQVTGPKSASSSNYSGTSVTYSQISKNGSYTVQVTASNPAGVKTNSKTVSLTGPTATYGFHHGGNPTDESYIYAQADAKSGTIGTIVDANTKSAQVRCQKMGAHYAHSNGNPDFAGSLYDYVDYKGTVGYMIGYLPNTPHSPWQELAGPTIWEC